MDLSKKLDSTNKNLFVFSKLIQERGKRRPAERPGQGAVESQRLSSVFEQGNRGS